MCTAAITAPTRSIDAPRMTRYSPCTSDLQGSRRFVVKEIRNVTAKRAARWRTERRATDDNLIFDWWRLAPSAPLFRVPPSAPLFLAASRKHNHHRPHCIKSGRCGPKISAVGLEQRCSKDSKNAHMNANVGSQKHCPTHKTTRSERLTTTILSYSRCWRSTHLRGSIAWLDF